MFCGAVGAGGTAACVSGAGGGGNESVVHAAELVRRTGGVWLCNWCVCGCVLYGVSVCEREREYKRDGGFLIQA